MEMLYVALSVGLGLADSPGRADKRADVKVITVYHGARAQINENFFKVRFGSSAGGMGMERGKRGGVCARGV